MKTWHYIVFAAIIIFLLIQSMKKSLSGMWNEFSNLIKKFEGFSSTPYWDVTRYSWGYGTEAPEGADSGTIDQQTAIDDAINFSESNFNTLSNKITTPMNNNQWAALLSFAYNLGIGNALKLVPNINNKDNAALSAQWKSYIYAGGVIDSDLVTRRNYEYNLFGDL